MQYNTDVEVDDDEITDYVKNNFAIDDIYDESAIKQHINRNYTPEDVFSDADLNIWATDHGYTKE